MYKSAALAAFFSLGLLAAPAALAQDNSSEIEQSFSAATAADAESATSFRISGWTNIAEFIRTGQDVPALQQAISTNTSLQDDLDRQNVDILKIDAVAVDGNGSLILYFGFNRAGSADYQSQG